VRLQPVRVGQAQELLEDFRRSNCSAAAAVAVARADKPSNGYASRASARPALNNATSGGAMTSPSSAVKYIRTTGGTGMIPRGGLVRAEEGGGGERGQDHHAGEVREAGARRAAQLDVPVGGEVPFQPPGRVRGRPGEVGDACGGPREGDVASDDDRRYRRGSTGRPKLPRSSGEKGGDAERACGAGALPRAPSAAIDGAGIGSDEVRRTRAEPD
jgi:hypothetical protein